MSFCSGSYCSNNQSYSGVNQSAQFLFQLKTGRDYTCSVDFGDFQNATITFPTVLNGSYVPHVYKKEGTYSVFIFCSNYFNNQSYAIQHSVQYMITGLQLTSYGVLKNTPYSIRFSLNTGSNVIIKFYFNGTIDSGMTYNQLSKIGASSWHNGEPSAIYPIQIIAWNFVSNVTLNDTFQISATMTNPTFLIMTPINAPDLYLFSSPIYFKIDMSTGSNVQIKLTTVSTRLTTIGYNSTNIIYNNLIRGDWKSSLIIPYNYTYPGYYNVSLTISNALSSFNFTRSIRVMSSCGDLIPFLQKKPVLYLSSRSAGRAFFQFSFKGNSYAGAEAVVSFNVGDAIGTTLGPFWLGMNFIRNLSVTPMFFDYKSPGDYNVTFNVTNPIDSKLLILSINVIPALDGIFVRFIPPYVRPNMTIQMQVYIVQGFNITLEWFVDGVSFSRLPRLCTYI